MIIEQTLEKLHQMKLHAMAKSIRERLSRPDHQELSATEMLGFIVDDEWMDRENKRTNRLLQKAHFRQKEATIEAVDFGKGRGVKKTQILELAQLKWISNKQNITFTGPAGVGKSYLAQVLGNQACRKGHSSLFIRIPRLATDLLQARGDGSYSSFLKKLSKVSVLILDDLGVCPLDDLTKRDLLEIMEDRYGVGSTLLTSQLPTEDWFEHLGGAQVADAICDRLLHNCLKFELEGDSMRKELAQQALTRKERSDT
jgi:DNA replication protein DnaC